MLGRDSRTLSKLFESIVDSPVELDQLLFRLGEAMKSKQKKIIGGLKY